MLHSRCLGRFWERLTRLRVEEEVDALWVRADELLPERAGSERGPWPLHVGCETRRDDRRLVCRARRAISTSKIAMRQKGSSLFDDGEHVLEDGSELFQQVRPISSLLELLDHRHDYFVLYALRINLEAPDVSRRRWRSCFRDAAGARKALMLNFW